MNNFDYTSVPGELLYCDRRHLDDFGVDDTKSLNYLIEKELYDSYYRVVDYEDFATAIFNTAYYICTMVLIDSHPHRKFGAYLYEINKKVQYRMHGTELVLSVILLQINAHKWEEINPEMSKFGLRVFYEIEKEHNDIYKTFYKPVKHNYDERKEYTTVPPDSEFMPCKINMGVLRRTCNLWDWANYFGTDMEKMLEFIFAIGKNEDEQRTIATFLQEQTHSSFSDGAEYNYCFTYIEREIYLKYHGDEEKAKLDAEIEEDLMKEYEQQWELDYYKDEFPKLKAENARMQGELEQLKKQIEDMDEKTSVTKEQFNEIFLDGDSTDDNKEKINKNGNQSADESLNILQQQLADAKKTIQEQEATIKDLNETITALNKKTESPNETLEYLEEWQRLSTRELAIFFSQALGVSFNPTLINQQQLANLAAKWTKPKPDTIRSKVGVLYKEEVNVNNNEDIDFSPKTKDEALNVYYYIIRVAKYYSSITPQMNKILDNINLIYHLNIDEEQKKKIFETIDKERKSGK